MLEQGLTTGGKCLEQCSKKIYDWKHIFLWFTRPEVFFDSTYFFNNRHKIKKNKSSGLQTSKIEYNKIIPLIQ